MAGTPQLPGRGSTERSAWQVAAAVGAPVAVYLLWKWYNGEGIDWFSQPIRETDFDSFLVTQGEHPTGLAPSGAKAKKGKKSKKTKLAASERGKVSGPFETFLKVEAPSEDEEEEEDVRNPLDFNSFLKSALPSTSRQAGAATTTSAPAEQARSGPTGPTAEQARVLVMYGTEYGFSREIAEKLSARLLAIGKYWPVLEDMAEHPDGYDFSKEQALLVACSTQGDGVPPTEARSFCEWLFSGKAGSLSHIKYAVCALGDKSYTHFCRCGKLIDSSLESAGAVCVAGRADVNKEDWEAVNGWMDSVVEGLGKVELIPVGEAAAGAAPADDKKAAAPKRWGKSRPYPARVIALQGLCAVTNKEDKNTVRVELDLGDSGLTYLPGDALGIYPSNTPQAVSELISVLGADPDQLVPTPSWQYETPGGKQASVSLAHALATCYDIKTPKADLFTLLWQALPEAARARFSAETAKAKENGLSNGHAHENGHDHPADAHVTLLSNGNHQPLDKGLEARASALSQILSGGAAAQEAYMDTGRHVVDVLKDFGGDVLGLTQVLGCLRQLQPRLYSISSSPLEHPTRVQATIAEVKYQALGADRVGVCSTYVSERIAVGQEVFVYMHKNPDFRLPPSPATPIIMVGPGTGLAPFRSFVLDRLLAAGRLPGAVPPASGAAAPGEMVLFFGCRRSDQDYLYGDDLEAWAAAGHITLHTAFSRQQAQKVYVQDRLKQQADAVWQLLDQQAAHFYVCGDASSMAGAVEETLLQIFAARLPAAADGDEAAARQAAQDYLGRLSETGRYQRDVWY